MILDSGQGTHCPVLLLTRARGLLLPLPARCISLFTTKLGAVSLSSMDT
jgi:hypothetical protein